MSCLCTQSASALAADFDLPDFSLSLPSGMLSVATAANVAAGGSASMIAQLQASVSLDASLKLSAMASALGTLRATGAFPAGPNCTLAALVASLNANLPALSALLEFNTPSMTNLGILASLVAALGQLGINPMSASAAAQLQASLNASVAASASASASASAALSASAAANAFAQAAASLGLPMGGPAPFGSLSALISAIANLDLPAVTFSASLAGQLMAMFSAIAQANLALGIDMRAGGSAQLLAQFAAQMDLEALASVNVAVSASASAQASASASATFAAQLDVMLSGLSLGTLADLSLVAAISTSLPSMGVKLSASPCAACRFLGALRIAG